MKQLVLAKCFAGAAAVLFVGSVVTNCSNNAPDAIGGGGQSGISLGGESGSSGIYLPDASTSGRSGDAGASGTPTADANCGVQTSKASKQPPDVLLVLDRSGSMTESIADDCCCASTCKTTTGVALCSDTTNCSERWPSLTSALDTTMAQSTDISWGLKFFGTAGSGGRTSDACAVSNGVEVQIGPAPATPAAIKTAIAGTTPGSATPTAKAITAATAYLKTVSDQSNRVILLATDGEPNCKAGARDTTTPDTDGTVAAIQAAFAAGFKVYVIGIGPSVGNLNNFAQAGGTNTYYPATSAAELATALAAISKAVASCTFTMPAAPPDPANLAVYIDGKLVAKDPANGWSAGSSSQIVNFNGSTCDAIKSGSASNVQVYFGCPGSPPPPLL